MTKSDYLYIIRYSSRGNIAAAVFYVPVALLTLPFFSVFSVLLRKGRVISVIFNIF